jgi:hypothetical protein
MRIRWFFPVLLLILASSPVFGLTVSDVVEMTQAGLGDEVIINQIRATQSRFDLTVDDIVALHNVGVSDDVLSFMITTAFDGDAATEGSYRDDYGTTYAADSYGDDYGATYTVLRDPEPEVHTYVHLGLGYYNSPWSCIWWDYWWPDWDYYWYAGTYCRPAWSWRYRPWYYDHYCWNYHRCGPSYGWRVWDDCDRYCDVRQGRDWDRVRWKSSTPPRQVTLASSHARTKAIKDADNGRTYSPLAQLEPRTKSSKYRSPVLAKGVQGSTGVKQYGQTSKTKSGAALVHSNRHKVVNTGQSVTSANSWTRSKTTSRSGATISKTGRSRTGGRSPATIGSTKKRSSTSRSSKKKSSGSSSRASKSSIGSSSGSSKSSPARSSGNRSSSKSTSSRSSGSKKKR